MVKHEELIFTTECLTLYTRCRINRYRFNRVPLYLATEFPSVIHHCVFNTRDSRLMLFREIIAVSFEKHKQRIHCGGNAEI